MYIGTKPQSGFISQEANQYFTGLTQNYIDLNQSISSLSSVIVLVNGVVQENSDLTLTSSTRITLGATLVSADKVTCIYVAKISSTQAPAVGTVTNDMLSGSITASKLSSTAVDNTNTNSTLVTGQTAITSLADTDKFLVSDASDSGNLKYVEKQYMPSGAMTLLSSTDLSSGVTEFIDRDFFTTYSSYKHFILDVQLICPSSNADLRCVFQDGSGDVTGNIQAAWVGRRNNASDEGGGTNTGSNSNGVQLFGNSASNNGDAINGTIEFWQPVGNSNGDINMKWSLFGGQAQQTYYLYIAGGGTSESGNNATGFVIKRASGNLTQSGNYSYIKVYGVQST